MVAERWKLDRARSEADIVISRHCGAKILHFEDTEPKENDNPSKIKGINS